MISLFTYLPGQEAKSAPLTQEPVTQDSVRVPSACSQPAAERETLIREAEENQYTVRRIEFFGNEHTRDNVLRRRLELTNEGEVFTREKLVRSFESVNRLNKIIYPVRLKDVVIRLDKPGEMLDMLICFKERRRAYHKAKRSSGEHVGELLFLSTRKLIQRSLIKDEQPVRSAR